MPYENKLAINVKKTKLMLAGSKTMLSLFNDFDLQSRKFLGVTIDKKGSWKPSYTGCPRSSFLYFIGLSCSTIGLGKQITI